MRSANASVTFSELIVEALTRSTDREAIVCGDQRMTYAQAADLTSRLVKVLAARGVGPTSGVVALSPNAPEAWLVQAATYLLGGRFSGLHLLGSEDDQVWVCDDAEPAVLVVHPMFAARGEAIRARSASVRHLLVAGPSEVGEDLLALAAAEEPGPLDPGPATPESLGWLQYTGGTTGRPKGVMMSHEAMVQTVESWLASYSVPETPRYLGAAPITHAGVLPIMPTLVRGGTVVLHQSFDPSAWLRTVQEERINFAFAVPTMLYALLDAATPGDYDLSSLETLIYGAAPMNPSRVDEVRDALGDVLVQAYAMTETCGITMMLRKDEHVPELYTSCGRPAAGIGVTLLGADGQPVADGEVGEICVRSHAVMSGYWKLPELTEETVRDGWLHTGDLARRDERGFFHIVDRAKDMIISGGFNIYPKEIEEALATHPAVAVAAVIGVPDATWGEAVKAYVVLRAGAEVDETELRQHVRQAKGAHNTPKSVEMIDALPMTPVGKINKRALRDPFWEGIDRRVN
jgi:fatty-acyl-CoA synthase